MTSTAMRSRRVRRGAVSPSPWFSPGVGAETQPQPFAAGNAAVGKAMADSDCVACHAQRFAGKADQMYLRPDHKVRTPGAAAGADPAVQRSARQRLLPRGRGAPRRLSQSPVLQVQTMSTTPDQHRHPPARTGRDALPAGRAAADRRRASQHLSMLTGWSLADNRIEKTFCIRQLLRDDGLRERDRVRRASRRTIIPISPSATTAAASSYSTHDAGGVTRQRLHLRREGRAVARDPRSRSSARASRRDRARTASSRRQLSRRFPATSPSALDDGEDLACVLKGRSIDARVRRSGPRRAHGRRRRHRGRPAAHDAVLPLRRVQGEADRGQRHAGDRRRRARSRRGRGAHQPVDRRARKPSAAASCWSPTSRTSRDFDALRERLAPFAALGYPVVALSAKLRRASARCRGSAASARC